jgi:O-antigen/teichoic acid export membrane protein
LLLPSTVVPGLAAFIGLVAVGHLASLTVVGLLSLTRVGATLAAAMAAEAPSMAALNALAHQPDLDQTRGYRTAMLRRLAIVVLGGLVIGGVLAVWRPEVGYPVVAAALLSVPESLFVYEFAVLRYRHRYAKASTLASGRSVAAWGATVVVAAVSGTFGPTVLTYIVVITVAGLLLAPPRVAAVGADVRADLRRSWRSISSYNFATYALNNGDQYILDVIAGPAAVGVYSLGYVLGGGLVALLAEPVAGVLGPRIIREWSQEDSGPDRARRTARRGAIEILVGGLVLAGLLLVAGWIGLLSVVSSAHSLTAIAVIVAVAAAVHGASVLEFQNVIYLRGRSALLSRAAWVTLTLTAGAIVGLTVLWHETGTAVATLVGYSVLAILLGYYARRS